MSDEIDDKKQLEFYKDMVPGMSKDNWEMRHILYKQQHLCRNCKFASGSNLYHTIECRRNAPVETRVDNGGEYPVFPSFYWDYWCGEFVLGKNNVRDDQLEIECININEMDND